MKKTLITLGVFASLGAMAQTGGVAINNTGANPNSNAMLDVESDDKGILIPRLTTVARNTLGTALALPDNGMMVYDKDLNLFFYWDGTQWVQVGSGSGDNWGTQVVQTSGVNISGDGTAANPLTVTDNDSDPTNELELPTTALTNQVLTWDGTSWVAQNAPSGADNWGTQVVQTSGSNISGDGTAANPLIVTDNDSDPTNEIELPTGGTNGQILSTDGSGNYSWVNDNSGTDNQNIQNLAFDASTNILTVGIENGNSQTVDLTALLNDADSDPNNEIQDLSLNTTTNILTITNNGTPTNIDLTPYLDNTDNQNLSNTTSGSNVTVNISGGSGTTFSINDADSDPTNEIELPTGGTNGQVLTTDGSGNYSWVNDNSGTDDQNISNLSFNTATNILTVGIENGNSQTVDLSSLAFPSGAVVAFNSATCPTGWAIADGTGGTPDLRGEFIRGLDNGRGVDVGRVLASSQTADYQSHSHAVNPPATNTNSAGNHLHTVNPPATNTNTTGNHLHTVNPPATNTNTTGNHNHTVDPPNTTTTTNGNHDHTVNNQTGNYQQFIAFSRGDINPGIVADGTGYSSGGNGNDRIMNINPDGNHNHAVNIAPFNSASNGNHSHSVDIPQFNSSTAGNHNHSVDISQFNSGSAGAHTHSVDIASFSSGASGGSETRPRNVALLYCVKQ